MKNLLIIKAFVLSIILLTACNTVKVTTDYDKSVDFSKLKTFSFYKLSISNNVSQLNQERILKAITSEMSRKGFTKKEESPDFLINVTAILQDKQSISSNTYGYGGYYRPYGWGGGYGATTSVNVYNYKDGSLIIDIINATTQKLIWQGIGNKEIDSPSKNPDVDIPNAVAKILQTFPPR